MALPTLFASSVLFLMQYNCSSTLWRTNLDHNCCSLP